MSSAASRVLLRQPRFLLRKPAFRQASTTSDAVAKSKDVANKASAGLSKVASAAGPAIAGAAQGMAGALRKVGGRTGKLVSLVESLIPPAIYYSKVAMEVSKIVFRTQKMQPPSVATFQEYFNPVIAALRQPATWGSRLGSYRSALTNVRNMDRSQWTNVGITTAQVIGFFTVGEMIGRMKIVGYRGPAGHEGH